MTWHLSAWCVEVLSLAELCMRVCETNIIGTAKYDEKVEKCRQEKERNLSEGGSSVGGLKMEGI